MGFTEPIGLLFFSSALLHEVKSCTTVYVGIFPVGFNNYGIVFRDGFALVDLERH